MRVLIVGGSGFIGKNLIPFFINKEYNITATYNKTKPNYLVKKIHWVKFNYKKNNNIKIFENTDLVIHLAWENLPNYTNKIHTNLELKFQKIFLEKIIKIGIKNLFIAGTCFEYGNIEGLLNEKAKICPVTEYGEAKNALRVYLEKLNIKYNFNYTWGRIFYLYGKYQSKNSLYNQLLQAIKMNKTFKMSSGKQIRDYLAIEEACKLIFLLVKNNKNNKIVNICSNKKITVKELVKK